MLAFNFGVAGSAFLGLFALISLIQAARKEAQAGCWSTISILLGFSLLIASFILSSLSENVVGLSLPIVLGTLATLAVISLIVYVLERRSDEFKQLFSRGLLGLGTSILLTIAFWLIPMIPQQIFPLPTPTPIAQAIRNTSSSASANANIVPTDAQASQSTPTERATVASTTTYTPMPSPSPTRTRRAYVPPTLTVTPEATVVAEECDAQVTVNLNVRAEPDTDADIVAIIPEAQYIALYGRSDNGTWWLTEYEDEEGWVFGEYLTLDPICLTEVD